MRLNIFAILSLLIQGKNLDNFHLFKLKKNLPQYLKCFSSQPTVILLQQLSYTFLILLKSSYTFLILLKSFPMPILLQKKSRHLASAPLFPPVKFASSHPWHSFSPSPPQLQMILMLLNPMAGRVHASSDLISQHIIWNRVYYFFLEILSSLCFPNITLGFSLSLWLHLLSLLDF